MSVRRSVLVAAVLCALPVLGAPQVQAYPPSEGSDGCRQGSVMTGRLVPGTGSAGLNIRRAATLRECVSSLLPGIDSGQFEVTIPWNAPGAPSSAQFAWSDGSISAATGYGNGLWLITDGPASGHAIQVIVADTWNGWYFSYADVAVTSAIFQS
ncbi:hypothetical protein AB0L63_18775 [Nocardia sp. NPDC051990]|uniref:hypothetical protein n=1 Tax=Nocardia sp. NPDC051990 TaxID=3155285 RepID=UPI0034368776